MTAKKNEMIEAGIPKLSERGVRKAINKSELAKHCHRRTRGVEETVKLMENLLLSLSPATDTLGVPLFRQEMRQIWDEQKVYVACLQDPPSLPLYTITGYITKGGVKLPVLRCARGSTSLESFHLHLVQFIPGTSANSVNFQAYLLEGISRWNASRSSAAIFKPEKQVLRTFDVSLQERVNALSESVHGKKVFPFYKSPAKYTGEMFGIQYLYDQSGLKFTPDAEDLNAQIDKGFEEFEDFNDVQTTSQFEQPEQDNLILPQLPNEEEDSGGDEDIHVSVSI